MSARPAGEDAGGDGDTARLRGLLRMLGSSSIGLKTATTLWSGPRRKYEPPLPDGASSGTIPGYARRSDEDAHMRIMRAGCGRSARTADNFATQFRDPLACSWRNVCVQALLPLGSCGRVRWDCHGSAPPLWAHFMG